MVDYIPDIITASDARKNLFRLIDRTAKDGRPVVIKGRRSEVVMISREEWNAMQETLYLHSIPGMVKSIKKAAKEPLSKAVKAEAIEW
jgi:prevent-host-death family protein